MSGREARTGESRTMMPRRKFLAGGAVIILVAACSSPDAEIDTSNFYQRGSAATAEQAADPEVDTHIGGMAEDAARSVLDTLQGKNIEPRTALPDGLFYIERPDETFMISLELAGDPTDLSMDNLGEVKVTRFFSDENGGTTESFEFARSQSTGEWGIDVKHGVDNRFLSASMPEMDVDGEIYGLEAAQADVDQLLERLETA